jgi:hypothetical protein
MKERSKERNEQQNGKGDGSNQTSSLLKNVFEMQSKHLTRQTRTLTHEDGSNERNRKNLPDKGP